MKIKLVLAALACLSVTACVTMYEEVNATSHQEVDATSSFGTLQFEKGYTTGYGFNRNTIQEYAIADETWICDRVRRAASFTWSNGAPINRRIAAGSPVRLVANTNYIVNDTGLSSHSCAARATFTPEPGRTYRVVHAELSPVACELQVTDTSTGAPPPDLELQQMYGCSMPTRQPRPN